METNCQKCKTENIYQDANLWICAECGHEWTKQNEVDNSSLQNSSSKTLDANGTPLTEGDSVIVIKDLKFKGAGGVVKGGTKIRNIRIVDAGDGHNISCKIDGIGAINLKSEFLRKV